MDILGESIKKIVLAGIGAVATSAEKSKEILDELVKKGELTVEQGKVLNEELKHNVKQAVKSAMEEAESKEPEDVVEKLKNMTSEELAKIKEAIQKMEEQEDDSKQEDDSEQEDDSKQE